MYSSFLLKSSKPKLMPVAEIFLRDAEMMRGLLRITGKHRLEHKENSISPPVSAFSTLSASSSSQLHRSMSDTATSSPPSSPSAKVPSAFSSTATHFTPIVLSEKDKNKPSEEKEKKVARSLKELKRNLLKNRQNMTLVQDIEQDAAQGDRSRSQTPGSKVRSKSTSSQPDLQQQTSGVSPHMTVLGQGPSPHLMQNIPQQHALHHGYMSAPQLQHAQLLQQQQMYQTQAGMMQAQGMIPGGQMMMQPGQNPVLSPGMQQFGNPPYMASNMYPMQMPGVQNMQQGVQMQLQQDPRTGMFTLVPVQTANVQLPSSSPLYNQTAPISPGFSVSPSQYNHQRQQSGDSSRGRLTSPEMDQHRLVSPTNSDYYQNHRRRSPGHVQSPSGERHRGRMLSPESEKYPRGPRNLSLSSPEDYEHMLGDPFDEPAHPRRHKKHSSSSAKDSESSRHRSRSEYASHKERDSRESSGYRESSDYRENFSKSLPSLAPFDKLPPTGKSKGKQRPRSAGREGRNVRAKTLSGGDIGKELQRLRSMPSDLEKISQYSSSSRTFESLDNISAEDLWEYKMRSRSIGALEQQRPTLRRSNSGGSVDYRALEVKVRDIPIDGRRSREQSRDRRDRPWDKRDRFEDEVQERRRGERREKSGERRDRRDHSDDRRRERSGERRVLSNGRDDNSPEEYRSRHRRPKSHKHQDSLSPVRSPLDGSPSASPPLSKDSGVGSLTVNQNFKKAKSLMKSLQGI